MDESDADYRADLARIHHAGFGFHADATAPGILRLLEPVRARGGLVVEVGCGSGLLTRHLLDAGHRVVATDASPAMLELAREHAGDAVEIRRVVLPDDPIPAADAVVSVGHVLSYLPDAHAVDRALAAVAGALRPLGVLALDLCDLAWGRARRGGDGGRFDPDRRTLAVVEDDWALISSTSVPSPDRFVRDMTTFVRAADGSWRRDDERHVNVLIDTARVPALLARHGVDARVAPAFGDEQLPEGLVAVIGTRAA